MRLKCNRCGVVVSTEVPKGTIVRGWLECVDCVSLISVMIPERMAKMIIQMEEVCYDNGIGPENKDLLAWIEINWPNLKKEHPHIRWPGDKKGKG